VLLNPISVELVSMARREISPPLRMRAAMHILDWLGCAVYGLRYLHGKALLNYLKDVPEGRGSALGAERKYFEQAAFHNACLGNIAGFDDLHRTTHLGPGAVVIPVALAAAEQAGASGAQLLDAIVRGYEVMLRVGQYLGPKHNVFFDNTSTAGSFGAAAAAADLFGLNDEQFAWALGNAGTRTGGLKQYQNEPCMSKSLHNGLAAQTGLTAALLAKRNFTGPKHILEGPHGLFPAIARDGSPIEIIYDPDGELRMQEMSFRIWPGNRLLHAVIDATLKAKTSLPAGSQVTAILVECYEAAIKTCDYVQPKSESEAKQSLQHAVALSLCKHKPTLEDFAPPFEQTKIAATRAMITLQSDPELTRAYPKQCGARISLTTLNGAIIVATINDTWGDPAWPLTMQDLEAKFHTLLAKVGVPPSLGAELALCIKQLPEAKSLADFSKRLQRIQAS
jgi:2-methylcitrate dehydratase PrpD